MLKPSIHKNDKKARLFIFSVSIIVFAAVVLLSKYKLEVNLGFDVHLFAAFNALINSIVAVLLVFALVAVKKGQYALHKKTILMAIVLSVLFLVSYICHHLFAGDTKYGGEGLIRYVYFFILITHIVLAGIILPFILYTAYRGLTAEYVQHKKLAKITWPLWLYVAVTGVVVYLLIRPYY